jgi:hypothetical protein
VVVRDSFQSSSQATAYRVVPANAGQDPELFLMRSSSTDPVKDRTEAVASSTAGGAGVAEQLSDTAPADGWQGLVLLNRAGSGSYTIYKDTSVPTGGVTINNGDTTTKDPNVTLTLSASDAETGIDTMRISTDGVLDTEPFVPYATTTSATLPSGDGIKTVRAQFRNRAGMSSAVVTDTIRLDTLVAPYDVPKASSPFSTALVPAFRQTISATQCQARGGLVSNHGGPLTATSCNPPGFTPGTVARLGTAASGSAQTTAIEGDPLTDADEADVSFSVTLTDVRSGSATGGDYTPSAGADVTLAQKIRLSDLANGGGSDPGTMVDYDFRIPIDCAATPTAAGSTCSGTTSADALLGNANAFRERRRTVIQAFRVRVDDSGANAIRGDADDRTFAQQAFYIR